MAKKVVTGEVRASYANVFKRQAFAGQSEEQGKYSLQLIIPKSDTVTIGKIREACEEAANDKWDGKPPKKLDLPLRDGDEWNEENDNRRPEIKGCYFLNAKSSQRPGLVDRNLDDILDPSEFQSGDYCKVSMVAFGYEVTGNRGVSFALNNIKKTRDGEPLGGRARAKDDFADDADDDWAA